MRALEIHALNGEKDIDPTPARKLVEHSGYCGGKRTLKSAEEAAKPWPAGTTHHPGRLFNVLTSPNSKGDPLRASDRCVTA